jgi:hypothetical protein
MMSTALIRGALFALSTLLGGFGIFYLYYSFVYPPVGSYAVVFLATASAIAWLLWRPTANS